MDSTQLNRDIQSLKHKVKSFKTKGGNLEPYFKFIEDVVKPEYIRLYRADDTFKSLTQKSVLIMIRLNLSHRFIPFHQFGLNIEL